MFAEICLSCCSYNFGFPLQKGISETATDYLTGGEEELMKQAKEATDYLTSGGGLFARLAEQAAGAIPTRERDVGVSSFVEETYEKLFYTNKIIVEPFEEVFAKTLGQYSPFAAQQEKKEQDTVSMEDEPLLPKSTAEESKEHGTNVCSASGNEPVQDILRNESAVLGLVVFVACSVTISQHSEIQIPLNVVASWLTAAFILGYIVSTKRHGQQKMKEEELELERRKSVLLSVRLGADVSGPTVTAGQSLSLPRGFWTALLNERAEVEVCDLLKERALKYTSTDGKSLRQLLRLRGTDMFLSDRPEEQLWKDELLLKCGLRDRPTFFVNGIFPWGSYLVYFDLPPWVKKFSDIVEEESDSVDIKALKVSSLFVRLRRLVWDTFSSRSASSAHGRYGFIVALAFSQRRCGLSELSIVCHARYYRCQPGGKNGSSHPK